VLISPYDPSAGFNVGNAMQRNKLIYALADASLVVSSDLNKGGTWTGAVEQLDKLKFVPVYVRSTSGSSLGLDALRSKGARPWPNPQDADAFEDVFGLAALTPAQSSQSGPALFSSDGSTDGLPMLSVVKEMPKAIKASTEPVPLSILEPSDGLLDLVSREVQFDAAPLAMVALPPADTLFAAVREVVQQLLKTPMKDVEIAVALDVSSAQAKAWLQRLVSEGVVEKLKKPLGYIVKQSSLFG